MPLLLISLVPSVGNIAVKVIANNQDLYLPNALLLARRRRLGSKGPFAGPRYLVVWRPIIMVMGPGENIIDRRAKHHQHLTISRGAEEEVQNFEEWWRCFCCIIMTAPLKLAKEEGGTAAD